jgi:hypothetical protein
VACREVSATFMILRSTQLGIESHLHPRHLDGPERTLYSDSVMGSGQHREYLNTVISSNADQPRHPHRVGPQSKKRQNSSVLDKEYGRSRTLQDPGILQDPPQEGSREPELKKANSPPDATKKEGEEYDDIRNKG